MNKLFLIIFFALASPSAWAQNTTCATRPPGDNSNACATTAFVENIVISTGFNPVYCTTTNNDSPALQAAINAVPVLGGVVNIIGNCTLQTAIDAKGHAHMTFIGRGNQAGGPDRLTFDLTGSGRALDLRDSFFFTSRGVQIYSQNAFTGILIDCGGTNPGVTVSTGCTLQDGATGSLSSSPPTCLNLSEAILATVSNFTFGACSPSIHGQNIINQNTVTKIFNATFNFHTGPAIVECGESWLLSNVTFEQDIVGGANAFFNSPSLPCKGLVIQTPWLGDAAGTWITLTANGASISGGSINANAGATTIVLNGGSGYEFTGVAFNDANVSISCTNSPTGGRVNANKFTNVTTPVGSGCVNFNRSNNSPDISPANGSPTIAGGACGAGANGTISGTNSSGIITIGAAATTTCTISFSTTLETAPNSCSITPGNAAAAATGTTVARVGTPSTSAWVITGSALASTVYSYTCSVSA